MRNAGYLTTTACAIISCRQSGVKVAAAAIRVEGCKITECGGNAIFLTESATGTATGCDFSSCRPRLVFVGDNSRIELQQCVLHDSPTGGVECDAQTSAVVTECQFSDLRGTTGEAIRGRHEIRS